MMQSRRLLSRSWRGGTWVALEEWRAWEAALPSSMPLRERYTATLLKTLAQLLYTAPFPWALTGGTAFQSYLRPVHRRYSTDLEIITTASGQEVEAWMLANGFPPETIHPRILKCALTPDGTLFVIHSYPQRDFEAAQIAMREFQHYDLPGARPPEALQVPLCSRDFLLATKLFAIQEPNRGGERKKDAYDLAVGLPLEGTADVLGRLEAYAVHRGREGQAREIARCAGTWLAHFAAAGFPTFVAWLQNYVPAAPAEEVQKSLRSSVESLSKALGMAIEPTDEEQCRFLAQELTIADLAPLGKAFGFKGDPIKQSEKMRDFVLEAALPRIPRPLPAEKKGLLSALQTAARDES